MNLYVIAESPDGPSKIGFATRLANRLTSLQSGNPRKLTLFSQIETTPSEARIVERWAHSLLWAKHLRNQWFDVPPEDAANAINQAINGAKNAETLRRDPQYQERIRLENLELRRQKIIRSPPHPVIWNLDHSP